MKIPEPCSGVFAFDVVPGGDALKIGGAVEMNASVPVPVM